MTLPSDLVVMRINKIVDKLAKRKLIVGFSSQFELAAEINKLFLEGTIREAN